jgi:hypothetical protein
MTAIVIPWRDGGDPHRQANFQYVRDYYEALNIGPVIVSDDGNTTGPFNRSAAYNRGLAHTDSDVIIWNEADTIIPAEQIAAGVMLAAEAPGVVIPFTERHELTPAAAKKVRAGADPWTGDVEKVYGGGRSIGQCNITSRATLAAFGGRWCEKFSGWGYDDTLMFHAFKVLAGPPRWVEGKGVHLWHPKPLASSDPAVRAQIKENKRTNRRLMALAPDKLRAEM